LKKSQSDSCSLIKSAQNTIELLSSKTTSYKQFNFQNS
jgi:hypothetical protein